MTSLYQQLSVHAGKDGLLLHPTHIDEQTSSTSAIQIAYTSTEVTSTSRALRSDVFIEVHGIIGILDLESTKYLTLITDCEQVAVISDKPIYTITDVAHIPLKSQSAAAAVIEDLRKRTQNEHQNGGYATDDSDHVEEDTAALDRLRPSETPTVSSTARKAVQDVKDFGTFAHRWISKGSTTQIQPAAQDQKDSAGRLTPAQQEAIQETLPDQEASISDDTQLANHAEGNSKELEQQKTTIDTYSRRILNHARLYYSSKSFYFSYDHNLSSRWSELAQQNPSIPLHARFELDFFWNRHVMERLINAEQHQYVLPLLQGFVGQRTFTIERRPPSTSMQSSASPNSEPEQATSSAFSLTLISRRSVKRAGLRYLRRGVDEYGDTANCVETEQILWTSGQQTDGNSYSLVQMRGSIPLFFSQSPFSFKPLPQMFGSETTNREAFRKHFQQVSDRYGQVQVASLVDKHGTEMSIGEAYEKTASWRNDTVSSDKSIGFEWFDFHRECKGMRFENVSILINTLQPSLETFGWTILSNGKLKDLQKGVLRTNCMDCLDRTNVTQSSVAGWVLQQQMKELDFSLDLTTDHKSIWFNQLWADNGDAISRQYAGTAALKGDFTRTRKRNWTGALSDFSLTLNRYYNNVFGDFFLQTCIDYLLGYVGPGAFDDFETTMMAQDYALDIRRVRKNAIDLCIKIVVDDATESFIGGWTLSCPNKANTLRSLPFEECVLLLTDSALYFCRFDWSSEKVGSFERVDLSDVTRIWRGPYITNALNTTEADETKNIGVALYYNTRGTAIVRTNTRSMDNEKTADDQNAGKNEAEKQADPHKDQRRLLAFKMLHASAFVSKTGDHESEEGEAETARKISTAIVDAIVTAIKKTRGIDHMTLEEAPEVEEKPIISLAEARKSTSYVESIGYSLKKLVW